MAMAGDTGANDLIDEVLLNVVQQKKPEVSSVIKVDGIPKVGPKGFNHLHLVITNLFTQFGKILRDYYPKSEKGHTESYLYIEYEEHESALKTVKTTNNSKLSELNLLVQLVSDCKEYTEQVKSKYTFFELLIKIATLLQPIPGYNEQYISRNPIIYGQYYKNKDLNKRIQDWMNDFPHIPELEKHKMMADAQLAMAINKVSKMF